MMQPTFLPWTGYFSLVACCDVFVLLDDFQFQRHSFHHRNRLFLSPGQPGWVTVPIERTHAEHWPAINAVRPLLHRGFDAKLARMLSHNYGQSPFFDAVWAPLHALLRRDWQSLADLNIALIEALSVQLGCGATFVRSSVIGSRGSRSERVADLLRRVDATDYLAAAGAEDYMRADGVFPIAGVTTRFQNYTPVPYEQSQSTTFVPYLSVLDMLLQIGPDRAHDRVLAGAGEPRAWSETVAVSG